ncbi:hypothetical protein ABVT39_018219 [Epinephelus coioides]
MDPADLNLIRAAIQKQGQQLHMQEEHMESVHHGIQSLVAQHEAAFNTMCGQIQRLTNQLSPPPSSEADNVVPPASPPEPEPFVFEVIRPGFQFKHIPLSSVYKENNSLIFESYFVAALITYIINLTDEGYLMRPEYNNLSDYRSGACEGRYTSSCTNVTFFCTREEEVADAQQQQQHQHQQQQRQQQQRRRRSTECFSQRS